MDVIEITENLKFSTNAHKIYSIYFFKKTLKT